MMRVLFALVLFLHSLPVLAHGTHCASDAAPKVQTVADVQAATNTQGTRLDPAALFKNGPDANALAAVLRGIANEPGEKGNLVLDVKAGGQFGTGAVNGSVEGDVNLEVSYAVTDENRVIMGFDAAAAVKAGISLAGLVEIGGKVEAGGSFIKLSFEDADSAAAWLTQQLNDINRRTGSKLWPAGTSRMPAHVTAPVVLTDRWIAGGVYAGGGIGGVEVTGEGKLKRETRQFEGVMDGKTVNITQITDHLMGQAELKLPFRGSQAEVSYTYDWSDTSNSPFYYNNGVGVEHTVVVKIPIVSGSKVTSTTSGAPTAGAQDLIVDVFAAIEKVAPGGTLKGINYDAFSSVVNQAYENASQTSKFGSTTYLTLTLDILNIKDSDGTYVPVYQRVLVGGEEHVTAQFNVKAVQVGVDVSAGKTERVYEHLGTDTVSYFQRQFVYQTSDNPWSTFKADNESALRQLVENASNPSHKLYDAQVAAATQRGGYEAGLGALEQKWTTENNQIAQVREDAIALADISNKWRWWNGDDNLRNQMSDVLSRYSDQQMRQYMVDLVDDYGGKPEVISDLTSGRGGAASRLRRWTGGLQISPPAP